MAIKGIKTKTTENDNNNIFWTTMSDLMLGLAIIFITLFVFAMTGFTQQNIEQKKQQMEMSEQIAENLKKVDIDVEIDKVTGDIVISDLDLFELGSSKLSSQGKAYLNKFAPIYIDTIFSKKEYANNIENIIIQGHTDSHMYAGINNPDEQYMKNMTLSLERANSVATYIFTTNYNKEFGTDLKKKMVVEGKSFSEPILVNGKEDYAKSRRVELHLKAKSFDLAETLFSKGSN